jgi:hypothetical protein
VIRLTAHLEDVFEGPDVANRSEIYTQFLAELTPNGLLACLAEVDPATERPVEVGAVIRIAEFAYKDAIVFLDEGTRMRG